MALTADQTAILELILAGDQSFAELGDLLGLDEDEVRRRAREALGELGGADPDRNVGLSAYLLGQADPIGRADAVRHLRRDADDHALATALTSRLREMAPGAELPDLPLAPGGGRARGPGAGAKLGAPAKFGTPAALDRNRLYLALAGGAAILVAVVLAASGVFSGGDESSSASEATTTASEGTTTASEGSTTPGEVAGEEVSTIPLAPAGSGDAKGEGVVGITTGDQPYLDLRLENLEAAPQNQVYVVWFLLDERSGYPLSPIAPDAQGNYQDRFAVPDAATPVLSRMRFLNVSLAPIDAVRASIQKAVDDRQIVIERPGQTVLQNTEPLAAAPAPQGAGGETGAGSPPGG